VLGRIRSSPPAPAQEQVSLEQLSAREVDVLRLIANGMENSEIAAALNISPRTAKNHVSNILAKLGLPSRVQAAVYAVRQGVS
jgi:DNA-binding NarL/FixJ family response regulator